MRAVRPLEGVTVLEVGDDIALAVCGKYLAALGANVHIIADHVESRFASSVPESAAAAILSAYLDEGKTVLPDLAADTPQRSFDIVLGQPERAADGVRETDEHAIRVRISDFGDAGPQRDWQSTELVMQAATGLLSLVGEPDRVPVKLGGRQIDYSTGMIALTGVMIALTARDADPARRGQEVAVSRFEAAAFLEWKGRVFEQIGNSLTRGERSGPVVITCSDGHFGFYYREADWPNVVSVFDADELRVPLFDTHPSRIEHRGELADVLSRLARDVTQQELYERLQAVGVPVAPVYDLDGLQRSPQYRDREFLVENATLGAGSVQPAIPVRFNGRRPDEGMRRVVS